MRALNMQSLSNDIERIWTGVTIFGLGDAAHATRKSGHNLDDTEGSLPELEDSDNKPEYRAIDIMVRGPFTKADADALVARLVADASARARLYYIIWNGYIWSRSSGWKKTKYTGSDQHTDHVHISGWAADDDNTAVWPAVGGGRRHDLIGLNYNDQGEEVKGLQYSLIEAGFNPGNPDGDYGDKTAAAVKACCGGPDGKAFRGIHFARLLTQIAKKNGTGPGPKGATGPAGPPGPPGELKLPATLVFKGTVEQGG